MADQLLSAIISSVVPAIGLASGLIAAYASLQNRALLAEVRQELAEMENRIIMRLNGLYVRRTECELYREILEKRIERIERIAEHKKEAASD